jgi:hypothetical protein
MLAYFLDLRAPEKLRFARQQRIFARFSLSRIEPVPLRTVLCQKAFASTSPFREDSSIPFVRE